MMLIGLLIPISDVEVDWLVDTDSDTVEVGSLILILMVKLIGLLILIRDAEADWPADTDSDAEADHSLIPMDAELISLVDTRFWMLKLDHSLILIRCYEVDHHYLMQMPKLIGRLILIQMPKLIILLIPIQNAEADWHLLIRFRC